MSHEQSEKSFQTIDFHTHLLNPAVRFDRLFDRIALFFFAKRMGLTACRPIKEPYEEYKQALLRSIEDSGYVKKACLYPVDGRLDMNGIEIHRDRTVCSSTEDVLGIYKKYPEQIIPFFSINPLRKNALDLIDEYVERGCKGAKVLQNYWGVDLNSKKFIPYYERLKKHNIPLVIHTSSEFTIESYKRYESVRMLELPLKTGVKTVAAHMGAGQFFHRLFFLRNFSKNPKFFDRDYFGLLEMLEKHENLYADLSSVLVPTRARILRHLSLQKHLHGKILFGTDYPVPFTILFNSYDIPYEKRVEIAKIKNPFDRYIEALFYYFPKDSPIYTNYKKLIGAI